MTLERLGKFLDSTAGLGVILLCLAAVLVPIWLLVRKWNGGRYTGQILSISAIMLVSLAFFVLSFWFPARGEVSAAVVPRIWVGLLWVFCLYLLVRTLRGREEPPSRTGDLSVVFQFMGLAIGYLVLIQLLGYFISTFLFLIAAMTMLAYRRWLRLLAIVGGWVVFVYLVFYRVLFVPLPKGMLIRLLTR